MPKSYMNQRERTHYIQLVALNQKAFDIIEEMSNHNGDKTILKQLRTGTTWIGKGLEHWSELVDVASNVRIKKEAERYVAQLVFHKDALAKTKDMLEVDRSLRQQVIEEIGPDPIYDMAEIVLATVCRGCNGSHRDTCPVFEAFERLHIPEWGANKQCKYSGAGNSDGH